MSLTINVATRGRPQMLVDTLHRTVPLMVLPSTRLMVSIDEDDIETIEHQSMFPPDGRIVLNIKPREDALGDKWNRALEIPADVYLPMADYTPYITHGFDARILDAAQLFPDGIGVVYTHMANASFPSSQGVTHKLVEKLGYMYPPYFPYWFVDHWIEDIAKLIDRISFANVQVEVRKKLPTQEMRESKFWATLFDACRLVRRKEARDIIDSEDFQEPEWRKEILRRHYPLIEYRSQWINDTVRDMNIPDTADDGGERYDRIKQKAIKMLAEVYPALHAEIGVAA